VRLEYFRSFIFRIFRRLQRKNKHKLFKESEVAVFVNNQIYSLKINIYGNIYCEISEMLLNESQENFGVFEKTDKNTIFFQLK
jgi:hypothetical protein